MTARPLPIVSAPTPQASADSVVRAFATAGKPEPMGFFTDTTVCIGCKACEVACKEWNQLPARGDGGAPDRLLGQKQLADRIRTALDRLPFDQKTALVLREIDGLSYEEIGFSLGIAVGTVKSRLARAREALRGQLRDV